MKKPALWTRQYVILIVLNLVIWVSHFMLMAVLPAYTLKIGGQASDAGLLVGIFTLSSLIFRPISGKLLDARSRRFVLITGAVILAAASVFYPLIAFIPGLMLVRLLHGSGFSAFSTTSATIFADIVPPERLSEGVGYSSLSVIAAMAIGPAVALTMIQSSFANLFFLVIALSVLSLFGAFLVHDKKEGAPDIRNQTAGKSGFLEKSAFKPSIVMFFIALSTAATTSFLPLFGLERDIGNIGLFFTVYAIAVLAFRMPIGRLADRLGPNSVLIPSLIITMIAYVMLAYAQTEAVVLIAAALYGIGSGSIMPILSAVLIRLCPVNRRGAANGTFFAVMDIGVGLGSILLGYVSQYAGFTAFFLISALFTVFSLLCYFGLLFNKLAQSGSTHRHEAAD